MAVGVIELEDSLDSHACSGLMADEDALLVPECALVALDGALAELGHPHRMQLEKFSDG